MTSKEWTQHTRYINRLCLKGEKVMDSERLRDLTYLIKDGHIVLISKQSGTFAISFEAFPDLLKEIEEVRETWGNIKTKKCLV